MISRRTLPFPLKISIICFFTSSACAFTLLRSKIILSDCELAFLKSSLIVDLLKVIGDFISHMAPIINISAFEEPLACLGFTASTSIPNCARCTAVLSSCGYSLMPFLLKRPIFSTGTFCNSTIFIDLFYHTLAVLHSGGLLYHQIPLNCRNRGDCGKGQSFGQEYRGINTIATTSSLFCTVSLANPLCLGCISSNTYWTLLPILTNHGENQIWLSKINKKGILKL